MTKQFYVYTHAKPDGSIFYVGKGLKARVNKIQRPHNSYHTNIVKKYGKENIIVRTMLCRSEQHALDLEVRMIAALRNGGVELVNLTDGGEGNSGWVVSQESRKRMSIAKKNMSPETRAKISMAKKNPSLETRAKMSAAQKARPPISEATRAKHRQRITSPDTRKKLSIAGKAKPPISEATRAKMSLAQKDKVISLEQRTRLSLARKGRKLLPETRAKISMTQKGRIHSPEAIAKMIAANTGKKRTLEQRTQMSIDRKGRKASPEARANMSAAQKRINAERKAKAAFRGQLSLF